MGASQVLVCKRITVITLILFAVLVPSANGCLCKTNPQTACNSLSASDVIFLGTVKSIEDRPWSEFWSTSKQHSLLSLMSEYAIFRNEVIVKFSVQEVFKGVLARE